MKPTVSKLNRGNLLTAFTLAILSAIFIANLHAFISRRSFTHNGRCCGPGCRSPSPLFARKDDHYDEKYFAWQTKLGKEKAQSTDWNSLLETKPTDVVADLGAGGGHILAVLNVSKRIAVEINDVAADSIKRNYPGKIRRVKYPEELRDNSLDLVYSTSAIEHFECPLTEMREMARKMKKGGRIVIGVKNEGVAYATKIKDDDINQHLWTWSGQQLYNLVKSAGFKVKRVEPSQEEMLKRGAAWTKEEHFKHYDTFIYHWAYGVKE